MNATAKVIHPAYTRPLLRATLQNIMARYGLPDILDELSAICAENAEVAEKELRDTARAGKWDVACGKLAVAARQVP